MTCVPAAALRSLGSALQSLYRAYGSFFLLRSPVANGLLILCTLLVPHVGVAGLLGGLGALAARRLLVLPPSPGGLEVINGVLAGLFVGSTFAPTPGGLALLALSGPLALALTWAAGDTLGARLHLPILSGPAWVTSVLLLAAGRALLLPFAFSLPARPPADFWSAWLQALGSFYGSPTVLGGVLLLAALAMSSRWLVALTLVAFAVSEALMGALGVPFGSSMRLLAGANAALTALMVGGLFATPGAASLALGAAGGALAALLSLSTVNLLFTSGLPALGLPFLLSTWLLMGVLAARRGGFWERYWLAVPSLPEDSGERLRQLSARGLDPASVPLRAPFFGEWEVYQGFDGPHTHRGPWRHALDFYRTRDGRSFANDGEELGDYLAYGVQVCSPAWGTVVSCRADLPDNPPGEVDLEHRFGNHVLLAVAGGHYVLLAHLQQGSVAVAPGAPVVPGQPLGRCGNSGRSPQPHLHLHVQTGPDLGSPTRPFHLVGVHVADGQARRYRLDARPGTGERVSVPQANAALRKAIHLPVGRRLGFEVESLAGRETRELEVRLDLLGHFRLESDRGARVAFVETADVLALYDRSPQPDPLVDALALALGLTPLAEDAEEWTDAPGRQVFDLHPHGRDVAGLAALLRGGRSRYTRRWDPRRRAWVQRGEHRLGLGPAALTLTTEALLSEGDGLLEVSAEASGRPVLAARLEQVGLRSDPGVPGWQAPLTERVPAFPRAALAGAAG